MGFLVIFIVILVIFIVILGIFIVILVIFSYFYSYFSDFYLLFYCFIGIFTIICVFSTGFLKNDAVFQAFWLQIPQKIDKNVLFFIKTYHFYIYFV